jgi:hypothetical protein
MRYLLGFSLMFATFAANADSAPAIISYVSCQVAGASSGATSVIYTGAVAGESYFNITNVNVYGFPFTQQARLVSARKTPNGLEFKLQTMMTGATLYLTLFQDSTRGLLASSPGDDDSGIPLACSSRVTGIR